MSSPYPWRKFRLLCPFHINKFLKKLKTISKPLQYTRYTEKISKILSEM